MQNRVIERWMSKAETKIAPVPGPRPTGSAQEHKQLYTSYSLGSRNRNTKTEVAVVIRFELRTYVQNVEEISNRFIKTTFKGTFQKLERVFNFF